VTNPLEPVVGALVVTFADGTGVPLDGGDVEPADEVTPELGLVPIGAVEFAELEGTSDDAAVGALVVAFVDGVGTLDEGKDVELADTGGIRVDASVETLSLELLEGVEKLSEICVVALEDGVGSPELSTVSDGVVDAFTLGVGLALNAVIFTNDSLNPPVEGPLVLEDTGAEVVAFVLDDGVKLAGGTPEELLLGDGTSLEPNVTVVVIVVTLKVPSRGISEFENGGPVVVALALGEGVRLADGVKLGDGDSVKLRLAEGVTLGDSDSVALPLDEIVKLAGGTSVELKLGEGVTLADGPSVELKLDDGVTLAAVSPVEFALGVGIPLDPVGSVVDSLKVPVRGVSVFENGGPVVVAFVLGESVELGNPSVEFALTAGVKLGDGTSVELALGLGLPIDGPVVDVLPLKPPARGLSEFVKGGPVVVALALGEGVKLGELSVKFALDEGVRLAGGTSVVFALEDGVELGILSVDSVTGADVSLGGAPSEVVAFELVV
jgi:hypothetical protein